MNHPSTFATKDFPLHASGIQTMLECPWRTLHMHLFPSYDESGQAADTGSAMHKAAALFHTGASEADSVKGMAEGIAKYPQADLTDAATLFLAYASDERNRLGNVLLVEQRVEFAISPAKDDPTGAEIQVVGTTDQLRLWEDGRKRVWDIKTSKKDPQEILYNTTYQMATYCVGLSALLGERIDPGGIIMPRRYTSRTSSSPVFYRFAWSYDDLEHILEGIRKAVASIRSGNVHHLPISEKCRWCHMRSPDACLPKMKQFRMSNNA